MIYMCNTIISSETLIAVAIIKCCLILGEETFNPKERKFSEDELKPQPMIKKSRKVS